MEEYSHNITVSYNKQFSKIKNKNIKKLNRLKSETVSMKPFNDNSKWFINLTNTEFPKEISDFLSLGPKFGLESGTKDVPISVLLSQVEDIIQALPPNEQDVSRSRAANMITNSYLSVASQMSRISPFNTIYNKTQTFLKSNPDIFITRADKGSTTVALDRDEYVSKSLALLNDSSVYQQLRRDPTLTIQNKSNDFVKLLKKKNIVVEDDYKALMRYNSVPAKFYGLPKVHKQSVPLRPIVSSIGSPTYNLSKYLSRVLNNCLQHDDKYNVDDTFTFCRMMQNIRLPPGHVLISLDVVSLFTNIPLDLVLHTITDAWEIISQSCSIPQKLFLDLIQFISDNCYFTFQDKFYKQIFGTPMGSPISPVLARLVMDCLLDNCIKQLSFELPFIFKYVDDIVCAVPEDKVDEILTTFNGFNPHLQFTVEREFDFGVPFLDTRVIRDPTTNKIILDWYRKPTASGRYLNFHSSHSIKQKINILLGMRNRVLYISDPSFVDKNLRIISELFMNNGFPRGLVKKLVFNTPINDYATDDNCEEPMVQYKSLSLVNGLSNKLVRLFKNENFQIAIRSVKTINNVFSNMKDKTPKMLKSNIIYCIPCAECTMKYYGQTSQWLKSRLAIHKSDVKYNRNRCAISQHANGSAHGMKWDDTEIIAEENKYRSRLFLEMYYIRINAANSINFKTDTDQLSNIYSFLINGNF